MRRRLYLLSMACLVLSIESWAKAQATPDRYDEPADAMQEPQMLAAEPLEHQNAPTTPAGYGVSPSFETPPAESSKNISLGALSGYGASFEEGNPWSLGLGVSLGINLKRLYLGTRFVYHFGQTASDGEFEAGVNLWEFGLVGGYDVPVTSSVIIRPNLSLGFASINSKVSSTTSTSAASASQEELFLAAGATGLLLIQRTGFIGLDVRLQHLFGDIDLSGIAFMLTGGIRL